MSAASIILTSGHVARIDAADYERVSQYTWSARRSKKAVYAQGAVQIGFAKAVVAMHRFILAEEGVPPGFDVDHINGDPLDNRRENLRVCTRAQNCANRRHRSNARGRFKGAMFDKRTGKWRAVLTLHGKPHHLGMFPTDEDAARAYDAAARIAFGKFAKTNSDLGLLQCP